MTHKRKDHCVEHTDLRRWRLHVDHGRQTWHYLRTDAEVDTWPQTTSDKYHLGLPTDLPTQPQASSPLQCAKNGYNFFKELQLEDGHWGCEYGGPMFLIPGVVVTMYVTHTPIPDGWAKEITRYLVNRANPDDGGWGLHIEGHSTVFGTSLNYVALRILGMDAEHPVCVKARGLLHKLGGAIGNPHWGKFWLAVLGCYGWEGMNPVPPELWLLPEWLPLHPWRWWIHTRAVYLPMGYLYAERFTHPLDDLTRSLREELYVQPYESINFSKHRNTIAPVDLYAPHTRLLDVANNLLTGWVKYVRPKWLHTYAQNHAYSLIQHEDENTDYLCVGPVNNVMQALAVYHREGPSSYAFKRHVERFADFMWVSGEGMMMNGTNGVQLWDTAFAVQAAVEAGLAEEKGCRESLLRALEFLDDCQIKENCREQDKCYRQQRKGAWPFSTRHQGYTVSDCTAEGLKAVLMLQNLPSYPKLISDRRLCDAIDVLLTMQNADGGFASYEPIRGPYWLEKINPAEVFGKIMIEYSYPECSTAVLTALSLFRKRHPEYRAKEIQKTIDGIVRYLHNEQREDGSWYGAWGICFTYASMFATESLASVGLKYENSETQRKACEFLLDRQMDDGGWGETYKSCEMGVYSQHEKSQVVQTAWALLALMQAGCPDKEAIKRGMKLIMERQQPNGEWLQESIEGVFNKNCMISYPNYKLYFPIKAVGMYAHLCGDSLDE
ncbi:terpene synthase [Saitoella complicata NRRL Y-17804]|nr:terpene synthase [Saitoella complicata NRRL Y-17804]ODQ50878.1 terpene synthase [Saitoella complicata NRRL Y-17804]